MKNLLITLLFLALCSVARAQNEPENFAHHSGIHPAGCTTSGNPLVDNTSCVATPSAAYVDASVFTGDACAKIAAAIATLTLPTSATIDARGITGTSTCSGTTANPFASATNLTGQLLLGDVVITTPTQWVIPNRFWVRGIGLASASNTVNTIVKAAAGALTCSTTLTVGGSSYCPLLFIGPTTQDVFAAGVNNLTVDCSNNTNCIGVGSAEVQEGGGVDQVAFINQTIACVDFDNSAKSAGAGISNSFIRNVNCTFPSTDSLISSADGIIVFASDGPAEISNTTVSVPGGGASTNACVYLNGVVGTNVNYLHCEHSANGIIIGDTNAAGEVEVHGLTTSATISHAGVWIKNANNILIEGLFVPSGGGSVGIIDGTNMVNVTDTTLTFYAMSTANGAVLTTSAKTPSVLGSETLSSLGTSAPNGAISYCSDCKPNTNPCTSAGTGALAVRQNGAWACK